MPRTERRVALAGSVRRRAAVLVAAGTGAAVLSGCGDVTRGYLPEPATEVGPDVIGFWNATWIAALAVGALVCFLVLWAVFAYRRRSEDEVPVQFRYHVPFEILYTVVPVLMVAAMFGQTVTLQNAMLDTDQEPDVVVNVAAKKWSWDFNYVEEQVYVTGQQARDLNEGQPGVPETLPRLVLPVDSRVEFVLTSRDVIHSFWVVNFLQKLDMVPGRVNIFQVTTTEEGTFAGKCAELCGAYHSEMLFEVDVVSQEEYDAFIAGLEESGNTGQLGPDLDQYELQPDQQDKLPEGVRN
ncbi:cytochrome C oxidase subunit II [Serinicoccus chungangensis]|uniref:cytochrome-c oxidase n=1 Tax=Serinicoccus chungangensis TaxID=767452 RepID=A0A0W8I5L5_9MICO|nr:cytochrome c oxidase subunit II [Serinicoccus chungangensis]KUG53531.1 cytochrome C oxidase subunit II [Serinicoccus chungangensis]